ncbi:MAG: DUF4270 domain-containing protein [Aureibaculum sp.]|nr:DUF4270 domain-containing protein [Aureibaculum sp.]
MTIRIVNSVKYIGLLALILLSVVACEKDFEDIGVGLVDNNQFSTADAIFEIIAFNQNVESSRVDGIPQRIIGVYNDDNFGLIKASHISQLGLPSSSDFGDTVSIDAVILDIPYYVTKDTNNVDGTPNFKLDSIMGNQNFEYNLSVYELGTFLNTLDPQDPAKTKKYYSNEEYNEKTLLYSGSFMPNRNDTVLYVNRRFLDSDPNTIDDTDTIKKADLAPTIKIPLDTTFFRNKFIDQQNSGVFDSFNNFIEYFRGIIIKADDTDGSLMTLAMTDAAITIYYTNTTLTDETDTDLNGDGDTDDLDVPVRTKQTKAYSLGGIKTSEYIRDYSQATHQVNNKVINDRFVSPDMIDGEEVLYIQGAAGSISVLELFKGVNLDSIRDQNWLINEANITLYVDNDVDQETVPETLYLYKFDDNSQILDVFTEVQSIGIGGELERDEDNKPIKYKFSITDYISEVLKHDGISNISRLGVKVYHSTDLPTTFSDTLMKDFSWIAKGVVLKGNKRDLTDNERLKLEIFYTINNE